MKTKKRFLGLITVAVAAMLIMQSCSKDDAGSISNTDLTLAQDEAFADALYEDVDNFVVTEVVTLDDVAYTNTLKSTSEDICYTVTVDHPDLTTFPKVITIDFGDGCTTVFNEDTITRAGQIVVTISNRWYMEGAQLAITFNNFFMNGVKIEGTRTITNAGLNERTRLQLNVELQDGKVTFCDTAWMTREANHVREWSRQLNPLNDTIWISGSANGINVMGEAYNRVITDPLVLVHCSQYQYRWITVQGTIEITNSIRGNTTIEHKGNGCDGSIVVTNNGSQYNYSFQYRDRYNKGKN
jgi:hypothetical protein